LCASPCFYLGVHLLTFIFILLQEPRKTLSFTILSFEALTQFGAATVSAENIGGSGSVI